MSSGHRNTAAAVLIAFVLAGMGGCGSLPQPASGGRAPDPIRIAVIDPQTGDNSPLGKWEHKGVKLAVDEANKQGGVNGRPIQLAIFDDRGDPAMAKKLVGQVAGAGYVAVLGSALSGNTLAMASTLTQLRIPAITSGQAPGLAALDNPYLFLNSTTSTTFDETLAQYTVTHMHLTSIALVTNDGAYGKGERTAFTAALAARGIAPVADLVVGAAQKDFASELTHIRANRPAGLFIGAEELQSGLIAQQARALGINAVLLGAAPFGTDVFLNTAGARAAEGAIFSTPYPTNDENDATRSFAAAYESAYGEAPEFHAAKAYDGARILIQALRATGGSGGLPLANAIRAVNFHGLLGVFSFDRTGVGIHSTRIATIRSGRVVPLTT